jgi:hypothetical protein
MLHNVPHNVIINTEIIVNQNVSGACNFFPFYLGMFIFEILRQFFSSLTDDFQTSYDCSCERFICQKSLFFIPLACLKTKSIS